MKTARYSISESESDTEDDDFDGLLFDDEFINPTTECHQIFENISRSQSGEKNIEKPKRGPKTNKRNIQLKPEKKRKVEVVKQPKPVELTKLISVVIDSSLVNHDFGSDLLAALRSADIRYKVQEQKQSSSITWILESDAVAQRFLENHIVFVWTWKNLIQKITQGNLSSQLEEKIKSSSDLKTTLIIFGINEYFRKTKQVKNRGPNSEDRHGSKTNKKDDIILSRKDIEEAVGELQLQNLQYKFIENGQDLGLYITQFTKALTELPFKLERNKRQECADWFAAGDSRECVRVDAAGHGLMNLWQQQICQFPNVTLDVAQAVVSNYNSPLALMNAYDSCSSKEEAELLLQSIPIRRVQGPLTSVRKIGPELSKKIHQFFCGEDGNLLIS